MKLFISWSGPVSGEIAREIRDWLPVLLPAVKPFLSPADIEKGAKWRTELGRELEQTNYGLVCLSKENLTSQWIAFEAGALSKAVSGKVATVLFGIAHADVKEPLAQFQGTLFTSAEFKQLILDLNASTEADKRPEDHVQMLFDKLWPELETK
jgi:hypothetical protein